MFQMGWFNHQRVYFLSFFRFGQSSKKKVLDLKDHTQSGWSRNPFCGKIGFAIAANYMYVLEGLKHHP